MLPMLWALKRDSKYWWCLHCSGQEECARGGWPAEASLFLLESENESIPAVLAAGLLVSDVQTSVLPVCPGKGSGKPWLRPGGLADGLCLSWGGAAGLSRPLLSPVHCLWCLDVHITYTKLKRGFSLQTECSQGNLVEKCHANAIQSSNDLSF